MIVGVRMCACVVCVCWMDGWHIYGCMLGGHALTAADALGAEGRMGTVRLGRIRRKEITRWVRKKTVSSVNSLRVCARARCLLQPPYRPYLQDRRRRLDRPTKPLIRRQTGTLYPQNHPNLKNRIYESKKSLCVCARTRDLNQSTFSG